MEFRERLYQLRKGRGISQEALALCRRTIKIPMRARCESLNAAMAAGIVLWEMCR